MSPGEGFGGGASVAKEAFVAVTHSGLGCQGGGAFVAKEALADVDV